MFEIDVNGLFELEGGKPPHRLALEPVANVFDEHRGYCPERKRPSYCAVTLKHSDNPRGVFLTVADDGAGFANERDIWTLFGSTAKRSEPNVSGRFNLGDKQLIAVARRATVKTNAITVHFEAGTKEITRHRTVQVPGTIVEALMPWSLKDMDEVRQQLHQVIPPEGLAYTVDGKAVASSAPHCKAKVTLPTVKLLDGVMRPTTVKCVVDVRKTETPTLYELGMPVCDLGNLGFPWSLDVQQKIPVPPTRDEVSAAYIMRLIGSVLEETAMDGIVLLSLEEQGAGFIRGALDWVRDIDALKATVESLCGGNAVRPSGDPVADPAAVAAGASLISGRWFTTETRRRMDQGKILPTAKEKYGGGRASASRVEVVLRCPHCGGEL